jgi:hypothetical protein
MGEPIADLRDVQPALISLHKALLDAERRQVERVHGRLSGPEFLQLISDPVRYGWLKPFSHLILAVDDVLEPKGDEPPPAPEDVLDDARGLLVPPRDDTPFGRRYLALMQSDPDLVMAHAPVVKLLGTGTAPAE